MTQAPPEPTQAKIASEIDGLVSEGKEMLKTILDNKPGDVLPVARKYHGWYTRALAVVKNLVPDRLDEFRRQYERDPKRKTFDGVTFAIEDYLHGAQAPTSMDDTYKMQPSFDVNLSAFIKLNNQVEIVSSCMSRITDILANIRGVLQADLFDSELDAARHLMENGHLRAAGAVAGVVLEGHLAEVCDSHGVVIRKKGPHISDFNDALKAATVFDVAQWRWMQRLADIRNLCDHKKQRAPTPDEVAELLDGVGKAIKTLR